jgi:hypothetical protein
MQLTFCTVLIAAGSCLFKTDCCWLSEVSKHAEIGIHNYNRFLGTAIYSCQTYFALSEAGLKIFFSYQRGLYENKVILKKCEL